MISLFFYQETNFDKKGPYVSSINSISFPCSIRYLYLQSPFLINNMFNTFNKKQNRLSYLTFLCVKHFIKPSKRVRKVPFRQSFITNFIFPFSSLYFFAIFYFPFCILSLTISLFIEKKEYVYVYFIQCTQTIILLSSWSLFIDLLLLLLWAVWQ